MLLNNITNHYLIIDDTCNNYIALFVFRNSSHSNLDFKEITSNEMELTETNEKDSSIQNETIQSQTAQPFSSFVYKTHSEQLYETFSVQSLAQWIVKNGQKVDKLLRRNEKTFIDNKGIKRYAHNWQPYVELSKEAEAEQLFEKTGCVRFNMEYQLRGKHKVVKGLKEVDMLYDWQRLWSFLLTDEEDEITIHAPLLRQLLEFCFHKRTCQLMLGLTGYSFISYLVPFVLYPNGEPLIHTISSLFSLVMNIIVYLALLALMKGNTTAYTYIFGASATSATKIKNRTSPEQENTGKIVDQYYSVHWTASVKQLYQCAGQEYHKFWHPTDTQLTISRAEKVQNSISFYRVLNISLKLLTRYDQIDTKLSNFDRSSYRMILLFTVYIFPFYVYFYGNIFLFNFSIFYCFKDFYSQQCQSSILYVALTFGYLTRATLQYIFGASVIVTLVSLAYAGEASFQLIHTWLKKFRSLRRVKVTDQSCKIIPHHTFTGEAPIVNNTRAGTSVADDDTTVHSPLSIDSAIPQKESSEDKFEEYWTFENDTAVLEYIKRDATEHYLLIREIVNVSSEIWSPALTGFFLLIVYSILAFLVVFILLGDLLTIFGYIIFVIYIVVRILILLVYPIVSMSHANAYLYEIKGMFEKSALDDYLILGGREHWIALVEACPIVWTYYGLWITYDRLQGLLYTGIAGLVAAIASLVAASPLFTSASSSV